MKRFQMTVIARPGDVYHIHTIDPEQFEEVRALYPAHRQTMFCRHDDGRIEAILTPARNVVRLRRHRQQQRAAA